MFTVHVASSLSTMQCPVVVFKCTNLPGFLFFINYILNGNQLQLLMPSYFHMCGTHLRTLSLLKAVHSKNVKVKKYANRTCHLLICSRLQTQIIFQGRHT